MACGDGFGWTGRILHVDLSSHRSWWEDLPVHLLEEYLGGRGLAVRLMRDYFRVDPFDPQMPLIFACGPLCGTGAPASDLLSIVSRSPLTGTLFDCPASGDFSLHLKGAGVDLLMVTGQSPVPVFISIGTDCVQILTADHLWGDDIPTTLGRLKTVGSVAAIGPAGENGVLFASIAVGQENPPGRGGLGAVMGAKKLKAVVVEGDHRPAIADIGAFKKSSQDVLRLFSASPFLSGPLGVSQFGTALFVDLMSQRRMMPTNNFSETFFQGSEHYSGPVLKSFFNAKTVSCCGCQMKCRLKSHDGKLLPEYEALSHFGALNGIDDLDAIIASSRICSEMGMDPISAAATVSAWGEIRGRFVTAEEMPQVLSDIAMRNGNGEMLSLGSRRMAGQLGRPELSMSVKSLELPAYDPRGAYGMALGYCTSTRGGCDRQANALFHEILRKPVPTDRFSFSGKARIVSISEDINAAADSMALCRFALLAAGMEEYSALLTAVTGVEYSAHRLAEVGRRICLTEHYYNCANGFTRNDDLLPSRFYSEAGNGGDGIDIPPIDRQRFEEELDKYYRIRGLNLAGCFDDALFLDKQP